MRPLITVEEAWHAVRTALPPVQAESVALTAAAGRILAQTVYAERPQPPFDRVMMDGIAVRWQRTLPAAFSVAGAQMAGSHGQILVDPGTCIEISTGAPLPEGADCIIPIEQLQRTAEGYALRDSATPAPGQFIHRTGSDCAAGSEVLSAGMRIGPTEMALLAANGVAAPRVAAVPAVAIVATGDELVDVDAALPPGRIRRSNDLALMAALHDAGIEHAALHHLRDDPEALAARLSGLLQAYPVLVLSGGVSMGQRDYLPGTLERLGVTCRFHGIAQRPGKPMWFGVGPAGQLVFALPGNPVSSLVCMLRYVRPALLASMGHGPAAPAWVHMTAAVASSGLTQFIPVHLESDPATGLRATPVGSRNSGDFTALSGTAGVVELPAGTDADVGQPLRLHRW